LEEPPGSGISVAKNGLGSGMAAEFGGIDRYCFIGIERPEQ